jgi:hypothetical protein
MDFIMTWVSRKKGKNEENFFRFFIFFRTSCFLISTLRSLLTTQIFISIHQVLLTSQSIKFQQKGEDKRRATFAQISSKMADGDMHESIIANLAGEMQDFQTALASVRSMPLPTQERLQPSIAKILCEYLMADLAGLMENEEYQAALDMTS